MSHVEYATWLIKIAMGYLGWSYHDAMFTDCLVILLAYEGKMEMLRLCFGGGEEAAQTPTQPMTQELFGSMFGKRR